MDAEQDVLAHGVSLRSKFGATTPTPIDANRSPIDVVATYNATSSLTFVINVDWDKQDEAFGPSSSSANWFCLARCANYALNSQWCVSMRLEYLEDKDGLVTGASDGQHFWEGTDSPSQLSSRCYKFWALRR